MTSHPRARRRRSLFSMPAFSLLAVLLSSCASDIVKVDPGAHTVPPISNSWVMVRSKPPTWFPRGVAADHPTDNRSGSWFPANDSLGTRFFIPVHGLPADRRKSLKGEAMAARNPAMVRQLEKENTKRGVRATIGGALATPFIIMSGMH